MSRSAALRELTRVRVLLFLREPEAVFWVFVFPIILSVVLGLAFRQETEPSRVGVLGDEGSRELRALLDGKDGIELVTFADLATAQRKLSESAVDVVVVPGDPPEITFDGARPEGTLARFRVLETWRGSLAAEAQPVLVEKTETAPGSRYVDFLFPGLLGMNLMGTGIWGIGFAMADMRQKKLLRRLLVTPMRRSSFLLSFILSRNVFLVLELSVLMVFAVLVLGVPFDGSLLAFAALAVTGSLAFAALGILVASRARTLEGVSGLMNLVMMPMWLCSGVFFSYERFPEFLHPIFRAIPLTAVNDGLRAVMLYGDGLGDILGELAVIAAWGAVCFAAALKAFRWH
jgi:ABC-type multidrug transport system permease subunit